MKIHELVKWHIASLVVLCCFICLGSPSLQAQDFSYTNFSSTTGLQLNGSATATGTNNVLRITPNTGGIGSAWYTTLLPLSQGFSTTFKFQISQTSGMGAADGIAFVIQDNGCFGNETCGTGALDSVGGSSIGYGGTLTCTELGCTIGTDGLTKSIVVEFDTWCNHEDSDSCTASNGVSSANEVGIQSCGTSANTADHSTCNLGQVDLATLFPVVNCTAAVASTKVTLAGTQDNSCFTAAQMQHMVGLSFVINGNNLGLITAANADAQTLTLATAPPSGLGATPAFAIEPILADGNDHSATITYKLPCGVECANLTVTLDGNQVLSVSANIANFETSNTDNDIVGFTGSTGAGLNNQDIKSWSFATAQTATLTGLAQIVPFSYHNGDYTLTFAIPAGYAPAGSQVNAIAVDTPQSDWAAESLNYSGSMIARVDALDGDGVVYQVTCIPSTGASCNPNNLNYTATLTWHTASAGDDGFCSSPGELKLENGANQYLNIEASCTTDPDPGHGVSGGSSDGLSKWAAVSNVSTGTPPTITITTPVNTNYPLGEVVIANYSCSGTFVECDGTVASGSPIDTSSTGMKSFLADAVVNLGQSGSAMVSYTVIPGPLSVSPSNLNFGNVEVGDFAARIVTVTNTGHAPITNLNVKVASVSNGDSDDFFAAPLCFGKLQPGKSCIIIVTAFGDVDNPSPVATLTIKANGGPQFVESVVLTATVVPEEK